MAKPLNDKVLQAVTATGASDARPTRGHRSHTLFVAANSSITGTVEVRLEGSPDKQNWATITTLDGSVTVSDGDFNSDNNAMNGTGSAATEYIRANVAQNSDSIELDVWLMSSSHGGPAQRGHSTGSP
jgi:hypothetical protein